MIRENFRFFIFVVISLSFAVFLTSSCKSNKASTSKRKASPSSVKSGRSNAQSKVIKRCRSYTGVPYKFGGTSRSGMDCSGLLYTSFKQEGINLPRTSSAQSSYGQRVKLNDLKEGDLVFFSARKGSKKITHVGLVTEVKGPKKVKFIHASTKLGVVESDLYAPYYISIFVTARRPFKN